MQSNNYTEKDYTEKDYLIEILDTNTNIKYKDKNRNDTLDEKIKKYDYIFQILDEHKKKSKL